MGGSPDPDVLRAIAAEFGRLGLPLADLPSLVMAPGAEVPFLARLRRLAPGATWRDVFPELPADWRPERERADAAAWTDGADPPAT